MAIPAPTTPARSDRSERSRQRILQAAGDCFAAHGFAKTTVEEIATGAGVSKALVYQHFRSKEAILEAALARTLSDWAEASHEDELVGAGSVLDALAQMHRSALAWARGNPVLRALFELDPMVQRSVGQETVRREMERFRTSLIAAVERGVERGELRADLDPERTADVIRILHMAFIDALLNPEWMDASDPRLVDASLDVLFHGIARSAS